jgi:hypothetical protein
MEHRQPRLRFRLRPYPWTPPVRASLFMAAVAFPALAIAVGNPTGWCGVVGVVAWFGFNEYHLRRNYFVELRSRALIVRRGQKGASVRYRDIDYVEPAGGDVIVGNRSRQGYCEPRERLRLENADGFLLELADRRARAAHIGAIA